jgi:uncharacterized membrane protein
MATNARFRRAGLAAVLTFGLTALMAVLPGPEFVPAAVAVTGWFLLTPLLAVGAIPRVDSASEEADSGPTAEADPLSTLQERYAAGEISETEFERRVERILETDEAAGETDPVGDLELERE